MLTAYGQDELVARAVEAGVFGYLVKPFREQDLLPAIHTARARHEELSALREEADFARRGARGAQGDRAREGAADGEGGADEDEAFARLRKASQVSGRPLKVVAEALIATFAEQRESDLGQQVPPRTGVPPTASSTSSLANGVVSSARRRPGIA